MRLNWLIFTVLLALSPLIIRLVLGALTTDSGSFPLMKAGDLLAFGLTLSITNINAVNHAKGVTRSFRDLSVGLSLVFCILFPALLAVEMLADLLKSSINQTFLLIASVILATGVFAFSFVVWHRLSRTSKSGGTR